MCNLSDYGISLRQRTDDKTAHDVYTSQGILIGNVARIGRFEDYSWSLDCSGKVDKVSTFGVFKTKDCAAVKVFLEYSKRVNQ